MEISRQLLAVFIQETGRILTDVIRFQPRHRQAHENRALSKVTENIEENQPPPPEGEETEDIATGCIPCSLGHLGTCTGLLNEAMRFARADGVNSNEVIDRVNMCVDEISALERVDLRPEKTAGLPLWEKDLAKDTLAVSRSIRHSLEAITSVDQLETIAAQTQQTRQMIGREWYQHRLSSMTPEDKEQLRANIENKLKNAKELISQNESK